LESMNFQEQRQNYLSLTTSSLLDMLPEDLIDLARMRHENVHRQTRNPNKP
jgi:hypothetical protein